MARTLYMNDGSTELVFGDSETTLQKIIYERLGRDCEELYTEIIEELKEVDSEEWEKIADSYRNMAMSAMNGLREILAQPRLNRKRLEAIYNDLYKNL